MKAERLIIIIVYFKSLFDDLLTFLGTEVVVVSFLFSYGFRIC